MKKFARIVGTGSYLPPRIITNSELEKSLDTTDEWITSRTGIKERRIVENQLEGTKTAYYYSSIILIQYVSFLLMEIY